MAISKTKIEKKARKKLNLDLKNLIIRLKKSRPEIANLIASPKRKKIVVNLDRINRETKEGDHVLIPGKVLSKGNLDHSLTIAAYSFSEQALNKLKEKECRIEDIEKSAQNKNIKIIK